MDNKYDNIPVHYCRQCGSLHVLIEDGIDICGNCGSMAIGKASIEAWTELYKELYGKEPIRKE